MKKYKLNKDKSPEVSPKESMDKHKDFGKLFHSYENFTKRPKKPIYKDPKYFLFLIIIVVIVYLISEYS
ncbi:hypothetical protein N9544_02165 [Flavobacteriales bacterium]|nr:hypothetical protein [Flavobacteriales bacterium]